ncbi:MAG TPA: NADH-quinone oxidoreductase subunit NuoG, partial [Nitrospirota bacterium]|nr:NADH-quinone oxidoreductase subunit NuoG [Nitrospirota bacterium]
VMSCMTPVAEGMRLSVDDPEARAFRSGVIEWLMLNHPHDCPVCDEGGECHLQDMTVMTGHDYRRTRFRKRTHRNQDLGPFINHEMNRCIQCYRCVRFYRDYAGGRDFNVFSVHDHVYFGRQEDGALQSEFSGNLVEICPTGVFTDKTFKHHFTRKWDLQTAPSVCVHCGVGCNSIPGERYGTIRRILNRYNGEVNGYFLCDRGRFGYEFVNSGRRIRRPLTRPLAARGEEDRSEGLHPATRESALGRVASILSASGTAIGIGSPRASLESNYALRELVGPDHYYSGMSETEHDLMNTIVDILTTGPARPASLRDVGNADAVLILGEDVTNTAPLLALAIRRSVHAKSIELAGKIKVPDWDDAAVRNAGQGSRTPLIIASATATRLDDVAAKTYHAAPDNIARLGFGVARKLDRDAPGPTRLRDSDSILVSDIAEVLMHAERPVIVSGTSLGNASVLRAAANIAWALCAQGKHAGICYAAPECNSLGAALLRGKPLSEAVRMVEDSVADTVIILENDLFRRSENEVAASILRLAPHVIVLDHLINETSSEAEVAFPAATYAEAEGTLVNNEGRAQRHERVFPASFDIQESWKWIRDIMNTSGGTRREWNTIDDIDEELASKLPVFRSMMGIALPAAFRIAGRKIPRQPHRFSGRTAMTANVSVHEPRPPDDPGRPLSFSMEGHEGEPPSSLICRYWHPGWNSVQALNKFQQEVGGPLRGGDPGKRLLEPTGGSRVNYFRDIPKAFQPRTDAWLIVPLPRIFGSEELSMFSLGIADRSPDAHVALSAGDASRLHLRAGETADVHFGSETHRLEVVVRPELAPGVAGLYVGGEAALDPAVTPYCTIAKTP